MLSLAAAAFLLLVLVAAPGRASAQEAPPPGPERPHGAEGPGPERPHGAEGPEPDGLSVRSRPRWGPSPAGAWTPYEVTIRNGAPAALDGEVLLVPNPPPGPGAPVDPAGPVPAVTALGGEQDEDVGSLGDGRVPALPVAPAWPTHRVGVAVGGGSSKVLSMTVLEAPNGYAATLVDDRGRTVASEPARTRLAVRERWTVAVLSEGDVAEAVRPTARSPFVSELGITHLRLARDLPEEPLQMVGLQVVVLSDFPTASLSAAQARALQEFVGLGGLLVLGGGPAWSRTLGPLPDALVLLRPTGVAPTSLESLLPSPPVTRPGALPPPAVSEATAAAARAAAEAAPAATATVAMGSLRRGVAVVENATGLPMVVQAPYGLGHVVQLAYDPFAEPFAGPGALAGLGLEAALGPALDPDAAHDRTLVGAGARAGPLWSPVLERPARPLRPTWPALPTWEVVALALYVLTAGPIAWFGGRARAGRAASRRFLLPLAALLLASSIGGAVALGSGRVAETRLVNAVTVHRLGADGTALVDTFQGRATSSHRPLVVDLPEGALGSTVVAQPAWPLQPGAASTRAAAFGQPMAGARPDFRGEAGSRPGDPGQVGLSAGSARLTVPSPAPGELQPMQTLHQERGRRGLEGALAVQGSLGDGNARVTGRLVNVGSTPLRAVRTFVGSGRALLADVIEPGQQVDVDAAVRTAVEVGDDAVLRGAAGYARAAPDQVPVVALIAPAVEQARHATGTTIDVVVQMGIVAGPQGPADASPDDGGAAGPRPVTIVFG